jgi:glycosyltransferase involved in cell wall biosynthesis
MDSLVLIPAFNEEKNLASVISEVKASLPDFDIVIVNDGSKDRTREVARSAGAEVVSHPVNIGYGAAVQTGFKYACKKGYALVVLMDADGQHDAKDAPMLVRVLKEHSVDMVLGSRFMVKSNYKTTFARVLGRNLFSLITYIITHKNFLDITSGFQVLNGRAVAFLSRNYPVDFPDAEVIIMMLLNGFQIAEAPATFRQRIVGQSMFSLPKKLYYPFKGLLAILIVVMRDVFTKKEK